MPATAFSPLGEQLSRDWFTGDPAEFETIVANSVSHAEEVQERISLVEPQVQPRTSWEARCPPGFDRQLRDHFRAIEESFRLNAPVCLCRLREAFLYDGLMFVHTANGRLLPLHEMHRQCDLPAIDTQAWRTVADAVAAGKYARAPAGLVYLGSAGSFNYGHWLVDDVTRLCLLPDALLANATVACTRYRPAIDGVRKRTVAAVVRRAGAKRSRRRSARMFIAFPRNRVVRLSSVYYLTPSSRHPALVSPTALRRACEVLSMAADATGPSRSGPGRLFVARRSGPGAHRNLSNHAVVEKLLKARGFTVIHCGDHPWDRQVKLFRNARQVVGVMGAAMTNLMFCQPDVQTVFLAPSGWVEPFYWTLCSSLGLSTACVYGPADTVDKPAHLADFDICPRELAAII